MAQKRFKAPPKAKKNAPAPKLRSAAPGTHCYVCKKAVERDSGIKPYGWQDHCRDDAAYDKGYRFDLTCSDECRRRYFDAASN